MSIADFKDRHAGERCAILANGETLMDFKVQRWEVSHANGGGKAAPLIIGLNRSWELVDAPYHCIIDLKQLESARKECVEFRHLFIGQGDDEEQEAKKLEVLEHIEAEMVTFLYGQSKRRIVGDHGKIHKLGFCTDLVNDTFYIPSVPYMALQIANWMGFKEMHFWGLDLHGGKFWQTDWLIGEPTARLQDRQFKYTNRKLKALGVRVVNHSKGTLCTAFERG